ncbi:MAG: amidohydrolase [Microbacteriaceae bacterium]|nr:MAG: amidohydrolase [Microbacteriaceae bacterium]
MSAADGVRDLIERVVLVDHHAHGAFRDDGPRARFENGLNEASTDPLPDWMAPFDSQLGFAVRRWCAPLLDLPNHAEPDAYWDRRDALGETETTRRFLSAAGVGTWIVDTGFGGDEILGIAEITALSGGVPSREVVRLETIAEELIVASAGDFAERYRVALTERVAAHGSAPGAVGVKSVIAYRTGFDIDWSRPADAAVQRAADAWHAALYAAPAEQAAPRLADPTLLAFIIHAAVEQSLPLQLHVGFGDRDLDLDRTNPLLLLDLLRMPQVQRVPVFLLHCYPFEREAGYLAQAFANVYLDVGLALNYLGAASTALVARSFEMAPFSKILYSSDAWGPAELHYLGARLWRNAMQTVIGDWVADDQWSVSDALRIVEAVAAGNARRAYRL